MTRQWVDVGAGNALAVCSCGWRELRTNRLFARAAITEHVRYCHREQLDSASRAEQILRLRSRQQ